MLFFNKIIPYGAIGSTSDFESENFGSSPNRVVYSLVAQLEERHAVNMLVVGSSPAKGV
jgi:hypothetical protein